MSKSVDIHESNLFECEPFTVQCIAVDHTQGILAAVRELDLRQEYRYLLIEFWNIISDTIFHIRSIPIVSNFVESLLWLQGKLISSHNQGTISVHDPHGSLSHVTQVASSSIMCLCKISVSSFCAGTNSGRLHFFSFDARVVETKSIVIDSTKRILSLKSNGTVIAVACTDTICIVDVATKGIRETLKVPRNDKLQPTIIWSLDFMKNLLVSGDSRGIICLWNLSNNSLVQTIHSHQSSILCVKAKNRTIFASGVDPRIARLNRADNKSSAYRVDLRKTFHISDVFCLATHDSRLFSGGLQHELFCSTQSGYSTLRKYVPCDVAIDLGLFYFQYLNRIIVWSIPSDHINGAEFAESESPHKILEIAVGRKDFISASAISSNGEYIACALCKKLKVYHLSRSDDKLGVRCILSYPSSSGITALLFSSRSDCKCFYAASSNFQISKFDVAHSLEGGRGNLITKLDGGGCVLRMKESENCKSIVLLTTRNKIFLLDVVEKILTEVILPVKEVFMDVQFIDPSKLCILCSSHSNTLLIFSTSDNGLRSFPSSKLAFKEGESIMDMDVSSSHIALVGTMDTLRIVSCVNNSIALLCAEDGRAQKKARKDRCSGVRWISERKLLFNVPSVEHEPSQAPFRIRRFGQN